MECISFQQNGQRAGLLPRDGLPKGLVCHGIDIGTARASAAKQAQATHHLLDIPDPTESCSAAHFATDAGRIMAEIWLRAAACPCMVGGTMHPMLALDMTAAMV